MTIPMTARQTEVKERFIELRGTWSPAWEAILEFDPELLDAYADMSMVPFQKNHLDAKTKELIFIAVDSAATHMFSPGTRAHVKVGLRLGLTPTEIMEAISLASTLGIHAMNIAVPILDELLAERGLKGDRTLSAHQQQLKDDFIATRGYWIDFWQPILELDPEMFEAYLKFSGVPWKHGVLEPKVKEFIYIAFDAAATHLYEPGMRLHMDNALSLGATPEEIIEVLEVASVIGIHAAMTAAPILSEEVRALEDQ